MRGSPLLRAGLVLLALLFFVVPLRSLTSHRALASLAPTPVGPAASSVSLTITSTTYPFDFEISYLGKSIWKDTSNESSRSKTVSLAFPPEGIDLVVAASWAQPKLTAVRVELARGDTAPVTRTLWGTDRINDVLTFAPLP